MEKLKTNTEQSLKCINRCFENNLSTKIHHTYEKSIGHLSQRMLIKQSKNSQCANLHWILCKELLISKVKNSFLKMTR